MTRVQKTNLDRESEEEASLSYRDRLEFCYDRTGTPKPKSRREEEDEPGSSIRIKSVKRRRMPIRFPLTTVATACFEKAWKSTIGEDAVEDRDILTAPQLAPKKGKQAKLKGGPKNIWYNVDKDSHEGWPLASQDLDRNAVAALPRTKGSKNDLDLSMDCVGKIIRIQNTNAFFQQTAKSILQGEDLEGKDDFRQFVREDKRQEFDRLTKLFDGNAKCTQDTLLTSCDMMNQLLIAKRESTMQGSFLKEDEENALRFFPPTDPENRIFSGKLAEFKKAKAATDKDLAVTACL